MSNHDKARRLAQLGKEEAVIVAKLLRHTKRLAEIQAERCQLLCEGYTANAAALGLDPSTDPNVIEPKD